MNGTIPAGVPAYVRSVTVNGEEQASRCHFDFYDTFRVGGEIVIELTADKEEAEGCGASVPDSLSTVRAVSCCDPRGRYLHIDPQGGFSKAR